MSELKIHSDKAWEIASHFSDVLASSTRTLAAMIDVALAEAAEVANQEQKPVAFIISGVLAELKKHKDASGTVWSGLNDRHPFIHEATALYASPVRTTPPPSSHVAVDLLARWREGEFESTADEAAQDALDQQSDSFDAAPVIEAWLTALATTEAETSAPEKHVAPVEIPGELEMFEGKLTKVVDASRTGWWRFHAHRDRNGYCDNPARGY